MKVCTNLRSSLRETKLAEIDNIEGIYSIFQEIEIWEYNFKNGIDKKRYEKYLNLFTPNLKLKLKRMQMGITLEELEKIIESREISDFLANLHSIVCINDKMKEPKSMVYPESRLELISNLITKLMYNSVTENLNSINYTICNAYEIKANYNIGISCCNKWLKVD